jgi:hypothetical protein
MSAIFNRFFDWKIKFQCLVVYNYFALLNTTSFHFSYIKFYLGSGIIGSSGKVGSSSNDVTSVDDHNAGKTADHNSPNKTD